MKQYLIISIYLILNSFSLRATEHSISGKILDNSNKAIEEASIFLINAKDSTFVVQAFSNKEGKFSFKAKSGDYLLQIRSIGCDNFVKTIHLHKDYSLGTINLTSNMVLKEVTCVYRKPTVSSKSDRMIYNIENTFEAYSSNNSMELIEKIPGVMANNKTLNIVGKGTVKVLVDGRMIDLDGGALSSFLESIPPSDIRKIEIINNPPAKYDSNGDAGLINIILKKKREDYFGGNINSYGKKRMRGQEYGTGYFLAYRKKNLALSHSLNYGRYNPIRHSQVEQTSHQAHNHYINLDTTEVDNQNYSTNFAVDYQASNTINLGARWNYSHNKGDLLKNGIQQNYSITTSPESHINTNTYHSPQNHIGNTHNIITFADIKLDTLGSNLSVSAGLVTQNGKDNAYYNYNNTSKFNHNKKTLTDNNNRIITTAIDYNKVTSFAHIYAGVKTSFNDSQNSYNEFTKEENKQTSIQKYSSDFSYTENIQAAYISIEKNWEKLSIKMGLRGENTYTKSYDSYLDSTNSNTLFKIFPTLSIGFKDAKNNNFSFSYNRRLTRPWMWALNPQKTYTGENVINQGNPFLQPQYSNSFSLNYSRSSFSSSVGYTLKTDMFDSNIFYYNNDNKTYVVGRFNNFKEENYWISLNYEFRKFKWWTSANSFYTKYFKNKNVDPRFNISNQDAWFYYLSTRNTFYPFNKKNISLNINYWYTPKVDADREITEAHSNLSAGLRWAMFNEKLSLTFTACDILNQQTNNFSSFQNNVFSNVIENADIKNLQLSIRYTFGGNIHTKNKNINNEELNRL